MATDDQISVLICEDSRVVGIALKSTVERAGCRVAGVVRSAESALAFIAKEAPDIVLMDIGLPGINGIEAARKIREMQPSTRIILVTGNSGQYGIDEAVAAEVDGYCLKDFLSGQLESAIDKVRSGSSWFDRRANAYGASGVVDSGHDGLVS